MGVPVAHSKHSSWGMSVVFLWHHRSLPSLWRHKCICRTLHLISIHIFEGHLGIKCSTNIFDVISHVIWQPYWLFFFFKPSKIFFSEKAEKIEAKLYTYDRLSMRNKSHTYDVISHMVWQPYWIYLKNYKKKNTPLKRSPGEGLQSLIALSLVF